MPLLLQEVIEYDWKFPAERQEVDAQVTYMRSLSPERLTQVMAAFARLTLSTELERLEWVKTPSAFSERLSAHLWTTGQIASFRSAAVDFLATVRAAIPPPGPAIPRLSVAVVGQGVAETSYRAFEKLRPHGTYYTQVDPQDGLSTLMRWLETRANRSIARRSHIGISTAVSRYRACRLAWRCWRIAGCTRFEMPWSPRCAA